MKETASLQSKADSNSKSENFSNNKNAISLDKNQSKLI